AEHRQRCVGILIEVRVVGIAPNIAHRKHVVPHDAAFDREAALLAGGCEQDRIDTLRAVKAASRLWKRPRETTSNRKRVVLAERDKRESRARNLLARIKRWITVGPVRQIVLEIVVDSKA